MTVQQVFITGASSGIGAALAELYAARHGTALTLGLLARRRDRLQALADRLGAAGTRVLIYPADVRDGEAMRQVAQDFTSEAGGVSVVIANAGISCSDRLSQGDPTAAADTIVTNVAGVVNTLQPFVPKLIEQGHGNLVAISSVAGFVPLPGKGAYCASKAAVTTLMDAWRPGLRRHGIRTTTICPGYVTTELTQGNTYPMPFLMDVERAARLITRAIERGRPTYVFPWQMRLAINVVRVLPSWLLPTYALKS